MTGLPIIHLFAVLFGFMLIVMTVAVGLRRGKVWVLLLKAFSGANGASATFLYSTGTALLVARALHYFTLSFFDNPGIRPISMLGATGVILALATGLLSYYWRNTHGL
jgi:uncharacterized membrane protein YecN with MAPEG domain